MERFRGAIGDETSWSEQVMAGRAKHVQSVAFFPPRFQLCWRHIALASLTFLTVGFYVGRIYDDYREGHAFSALPQFQENVRGFGAPEGWNE